MGAKPPIPHPSPLPQPFNIPQPRPPLEEPSASPTKASPVSANRVIRHGFQQRAEAVVKKAKAKARSAVVSPSSRGQLIKASDHLFGFASKLMEEKAKFLHKRQQEELKLLKAREELIKEQLQISRARGDSSVLRSSSSMRGQSQPVSPVRPRPVLQWEAEDLVSEAEQRLNRQNEGSFLRPDPCDLSKAAFPASVSSIHKTPPRAKKPNCRTQSSPTLVKVDLSSVSKYRRPAKPRGSPCKSPEVKDLLVLLQDSSLMEDFPKVRKFRP